MLVLKKDYSCLALCHSNNTYLLLFVLTFKDGKRIIICNVYIFIIFSLLNGTEILYTIEFNTTWRVFLKLERKKERKNAKPKRIYNMVLALTQYLE